VGQELFMLQLSPEADQTVVVPNLDRLKPLAVAVVVTITINQTPVFLVSGVLMAAAAVVVYRLLRVTVAQVPLLVVLLGEMVLLALTVQVVEVVVQVQSELMAQVQRRVVPVALVLPQLLRDRL
jgi:hypothetical protein